MGKSPRGGDIEGGGKGTGLLDLVDLLNRLPPLPVRRARRRGWQPGQLLPPYHPLFLRKEVNCFTPTTISSCSVTSRLFHLHLTHSVLAIPSSFLSLGSSPIRHRHRCRMEANCHGSRIGLARRTVQCPAHGMDIDGQIPCKSLPV